jgi:hypothetical protein
VKRDLRPFDRHGGRVMATTGRRSLSGRATKVAEKKVRLGGEQSGAVPIG